MATYITLLIFTAARRVFAFSQLLIIARRFQDEEVEAFLEKSIAHDRETLRKEALWRAARQPQGTGRGKAVDIDNAIDRLVGAMHKSVQNLVSSVDPGHPIVAKGREFNRAVFPDGAHPIVTLQHEDQLGVMEELLERFDGPLRSHISELSLTIYVDQLRTLVPQFRSELKKQEPRPAITFDEVRAAREQGQENLLAIVARILGENYTNSTAHVERRNEYLSIVFEQNERIRSHRSRRRRVMVDVNPDTGEEFVIEDDIDMPADQPVPA
ncbi:MAG: hypothetical protein ACNA8W_21800 [Bradymonadaceae bacterium]